MSRAQGDGYRTHTDHELNAYKWRLRDKVAKLADHKEKWYRAGQGWILAEDQNRMVNPNGSWKWHGWEVEAHEYWITVFPEECVEIRDGKPVATGWSQVRKVIDDDKAAANTFFKETALPLARDLETWIPTEIDNAPAFDYETARDWHVKEIMRTTLVKRPDVVKTVKGIIDRVVKDEERKERVKTVKEVSEL